MEVAVVSIAFHSSNAMLIHGFCGDDVSKTSTPRLMLHVSNEPSVSLDMLMLTVHSVIKSVAFELSRTIEK